MVWSWCSCDIRVGCPKMPLLEDGILRFSDVSLRAFVVAIGIGQETAESGQAHDACELQTLNALKNTKFLQQLQ